MEEGDLEEGEEDREDIFVKLPPSFGRFGRFDSNFGGVGRVLRAWRGD